MSTCPDRETLELLVVDRLSPNQSSDVRAHAAGCDVCRARLQTLQKEASLAHEIRELAAARISALRHPFIDPFVSSAMPEQPAARIPGYKFTRRIQRGGQGTVYEAVQESTRRRVAIKVIDRDVAEEPRARRRFEREVELAARLRHPGIVTVHDSGAFDGHHFIVMAYIEGERLDAYARNHNLSAERKLDLFLQIADAVTHAHQQGVIHRDLKPSNILIDAEHRAHVLDFGLAKQSHASDQSVDRTEISEVGQVFGTVPYMSPEHVGGKPGAIEARSDVYSLGVLLYQLCTGAFPYETTGSPSQVYMNIASAEPARPSLLKPDVIDDELEAIMLKALEKRLDHRYATVDAFAADIRRYRAGETIEAKRYSTWSATWKAIRRHRVAVAITASFVALLTVALVVTAYLKLQADRGQAAATTARKEAQWQSYLGNIAAADSALKLHDPVGARARLNVIPKAQRDWTWRYLDSHVDESLAAYRIHDEPLNWVTFSPDGRLLASAAMDGTARIVEVRDGRILHAQEGHITECAAVAFHPTQPLAASCDGPGRIFVWNRNTGYIERSFDSLTQWGFRLAYDHEGDRIAVGGAQGQVAVFGPEDSTPLFNKRVHEWNTAGVGFTTNGNVLVTAGADGYATSWNLGDGALIAKKRVHREDVTSADIKPELALMVTTGLDQAIRLWTIPQFEPVASLSDMTLGTVVGALSPVDPVIAFTGRDILLYLWPYHDTQYTFAWHGSETRILNLTYDPSGNLIATGDQAGTIRLWPSSPLDYGEVLRGHYAKISALAISPDGRIIASGGKDFTVWLWDAETGEPIASLPHYFEITDIGFLPNGKSLVTSDNEGAIHIWDLHTHTKTRSYCAHTDSVRSFDIAQDGAMIASVAGEGSAILASTDGVILRAIATPECAKPYSISLDHGGNRAIVGDTVGHVAIYDLPTGNLQKSFTVHEGQPVTDLAISSDHAALATACGTSVQLYDMSTWALMNSLYGHADQVTAIAFDATGQRIVSGSADQSVKVWDAATGANIITLTGHTDNVTGVAADPFGRGFVSASTDRTLRLWRARKKPGVDNYRMRRAAERAVEAIPTDDVDSQQVLDACVSALCARINSTQETVSAGSVREAVGRALTRRRLHENEKSGLRSIFLENSAWDIAKTPAKDDAVYATALANAAEACALAPANWVALKTLGAAQYRTHHYPESVETFRRCQDMRTSCQPRYVSDLPFYAMACWQAGDHASARGILQKAREIASRSFPERDNVIWPLIDEATALISEAPATSTSAARH